MKIDTLTTMIGTVDLSIGMLMLSLLGVSLWLAYGIRIDAAEVIGANIIAGALVFTSAIHEATLQNMMCTLRHGAISSIYQQTHRRKLKWHNLILI